MTDPKPPREFSDMSDNPTNSGWVGGERDFDEVDPRNQGEEKIPDEDPRNEWDNWEGERFD